MKKLKLTKVIASSLIVALILALNPIGTSASWKQDSNGWWYAEGSNYSTGWRLIDGKYYYFKSDGYMIKNAMIDGWYINGSGQAVATMAGSFPIRIPANWVKIKDETYATDNRSIFYYNAKNTSGIGQQDIIKIIKAGILPYSSELKTIEKIYNEHKATCFEYLMKTDSGIKKTYVVIIFDNDEKSHIFTIISDSNSYEADKQQLEDIINLTLTL